MQGAREGGGGVPESRPRHVSTGWGVFVNRGQSRGQAAGGGDAAAEVAAAGLGRSHGRWSPCQVLPVIKNVINICHVFAAGLGFRLAVSAHTRPANALARCSWQKYHCSLMFSR